MDKEAIKQLLPHRDPMLLIEEAWLEGDEAVATYKVRGDEWFLQGHFPGNPVVPGVILCEMMGQSACVLVKQDGDFTPYFSGMDQIRFKNKVLPGDTIVFRSRVERTKGPFYFIKSTGSVEGKLCVSGDLSFAVVKNQ